MVGGFGFDTVRDPPDVPRVEVRRHWGKYYIHLGQQPNAEIPYMSHARSGRYGSSARVANRVLPYWKGENQIKRNEHVLKRLTAARILT